MSILTDDESSHERDPEQIRDSLGEIVHKLDQTTSSSHSWGESISANRQRWEELKREIAKRQKALKALVMDKKAGIIGPEEFERQYRVLQDELAQLEFEVYNIRLGTHIE